MEERVPKPENGKHLKGISTVEDGLASACPERHAPPGRRDARLETPGLCGEPPRSPEGSLVPGSRAKPPAPAPSVATYFKAWWGVGPRPELGLSTRAKPRHLATLPYEAMLPQDRAEPILLDPKLFDPGHQTPLFRAHGSRYTKTNVCWLGQCDGCGHGAVRRHAGIPMEGAEELIHSPRFFQTLKNTEKRCKSAFRRAWAEPSSRRLRRRISLESTEFGEKRPYSLSF